MLIASIIRQRSQEVLRGTMAAATPKPVGRRRNQMPMLRTSVMNKEPFTLANIKSKYKEGICEVYPGLFTGNHSDALDTEELTRRNITVIVNMAEECGNAEGSTKVGYDDHPLPEGLCVLNLNQQDDGDKPIVKIFLKTIVFIENALSEGRKVLIHCRAGRSRAPTMTVSYIMMKESVSHKDALFKFSQKYEAYREHSINFGFCLQLDGFEETVTRWKLYCEANTKDGAVVDRLELLRRFQEL